MYSENREQVMTPMKLNFLYQKYKYKSFSAHAAANEFKNYAVIHYPTLVVQKDLNFLKNFNSSHLKSMVNSDYVRVVKAPRGAPVGRSGQSLRWYKLTALGRLESKKWN